MNCVTVCGAGLSRVESSRWWMIDGLRVRARGGGGGVRDVRIICLSEYADR